MQDERSPLHAASEGAARRAVKGKLRVLIADDDRDMVATLAAILNDEGHTVREVYRGTEVLRLITAALPVMNTIGTSGAAASAFTVATKSMPSMYGMAMSTSIRSGGDSRSERPATIASSARRTS